MRALQGIRDQASTTLIAVVMFIVLEITIIGYPYLANIAQKSKIDTKISVGHMCATWKLISLND
jgi:hypothetical protein